MRVHPVGHCFGILRASFGVRPWAVAGSPTALCIGWIPLATRLSCTILPLDQTGVVPTEASFATLPAIFTVRRSVEAATQQARSSNSRNKHSNQGKRERRGLQSSAPLSF